MIFQDVTFKTADDLSITISGGRRGFCSRIFAGRENSCRPRLSLFVAGCLAIVLSSGCGSRKTAAGRQPPPTQPAETSTDAVDAVKRSADVSDASVTPATAAVAAKRSKPAPTPAPSGYTEEGNASWYGAPFHGRRASNGEVYDMYKLTAAHRTLPFETTVRVTNLKNGRSTVVRITDRGPFVENRIIDLSLGAAREIELVGPGIAPVRVEVLGGVDPTSGFFTVQVGAFRERANAEQLRDRLNASYSPVFIQQYDSPDGVYYRVRVGKIPGEDAARQFGEQLHDREGFTALVTRLDEGRPRGGNP